MTSKEIKPATPLPWRVSKAEGGAFPEGWRVVQSVAPVAQVTKIRSEQNARYIAHACNAYPQLVEKMQHALRLGREGADDATIRAAMVEILGKALDACGESK